MSDCAYYSNGQYCGVRPARQYLHGPRCTEHTPATLVGRDEPDQVAHPKAIEEVITTELTEAITHDVATRPRSLQAELGPSEIGEECQRKLAYRIAAWPKANRDVDPLASFIGVAAHESIAVALEKVNERRPGTWLIEKRVHTSNTLSGSCDAFHIPTNSVVDHKFVGPASMRKYRSDGPRPTYIVQTNAYALGWERAGYTPKRVVIAFYPRGGNLKDLYVWSAPYDRQIALNALTRVDIIRNAWLALDPESNPANWAAFPSSASHACTFCPWYAPGSIDLSKGCPSEPGAVNPRASLEELIV